MEDCSGVAVLLWSRASWRDYGQLRLGNPGIAGIVEKAYNEQTHGAHKRDYQE